MLGAAHQLAHRWLDQQRHLLFHPLRGLQPSHQLGQLGAQFRWRLGGDAPEQPGTLLELQLHRYAGAELLQQLVAEAGEEVQPGFDGEFVAAHRLRHQARHPVVVAEGLQRYTLPIRLADLAPEQVGGQLVMAVGEDHRADIQRLMAQAFGGETPPLHDRLHRFDGQPRLLGRANGTGFGQLNRKHRSWLLYAWQTFRSLECVWRGEPADAASRQRWPLEFRKRRDGKSSGGFVDA
ncbi:hypothetical protein D3C76_1100390 [compost metagenome]